MAHKAVAPLLVLCLLASATVSHGARPIASTENSAETFPSASLPSSEEGKEWSRENEETTSDDSVVSVSLPGSDNVIAAVTNPHRHVAAKTTSSFSVSLPGSDNEIVAFGVPTTAANSVVVVDASDAVAVEGGVTKEENDSTVHVSLPGSDNEIWAAHVPHRTSDVVVATDAEAVMEEEGATEEGEATPSGKSHPWKFFPAATATAAAASAHPASDDTDSTFHVSLPGSDNEIWAAHVPHRESNVVLVTDESDRDATTTAISTSATNAATTSHDDNTASVSLPGSDNIIEAFHIRGNKKKTTSFQVSLPGSDNVMTAYGVPERKGMIVVATEDAEVAGTTVAERTTVGNIAEANTNADDVFTVSLPGSDNVIAALHLPEKRKFVVAEA
ncbi:hypothetical protein CLOP_g7363 [Closterium sp. NIES-67]|nr:hypothetical protein CLOP_g7363 [Closterium sp. NIES-67]